MTAESIETDYLCTPQEAKALFGDINHDLASAENNIREVIRLRAWEPLGYESFTDAWQDQMKGRLLGIAIRADVIFQMFKENASDEAIISALGSGSGVAASTLAALRAEHALGIDPSQATGRPASPRERRATNSVVMRIEWDRGEVRNLRKKALQNGINFEEKCREFIEEGFQRLFEEAEKDSGVRKAQ